MNTRRWWALSALSLAVFAVGIDTIVLTVALPTLSVDLRASTSQLQWFTAAYTLVLAAALLPAGSLGDRFGRKRLLLGALILFGIASPACAYARSAAELIAARAALGLAAAVILPLSMAAVPVLFPGRDEQRRAMTIWVTATALGLPLGPILGGWLLQTFWWGSVFLVNVPLVLCAVVAVTRLVPESSGAVAGRFDIAGALLSVAGLLGVTYGLIAAGAYPWGHLGVLVPLAAGLTALVAFGRRERRCRHPLVDPTLLRRREFTVGAGLAALVNFTMFGVLFTLPLYLQSVLGADAFETGLGLLPLIGGLVVGARGVTVLSVWMGPGAVIGIGFALLAVGCGVGTTTSPGSGTGLLIGWLTVAGVGLGVIMPTAIAAATATLTPDDAASGSALTQALRQVGGTIGVAVLGTALTATYCAHLTGLPAGLPPQVRDAVSASASSGATAARRLGLPDLVTDVHAAFVDGMAVALWISVAAAVAGLVGACVLLPLRAEPAPPQPHPDATPEYAELPPMNHRG
ncbi:MFS transporter [Speluncibacter jeojiensis]|uniref:MFS transporter n=1 Tax=Speluncibacter jeojiensis TaxID=2710754 RepID=A0A9X4RFD4_9ACTN|nr:MFS transporter [Corynebacteriales bacterium D3-21]